MKRISSIVVCALLALMVVVGGVAKADNALHVTGTLTASTYSDSMYYDPYGHPVWSYADFIETADGYTNGHAAADYAISISHVWNEGYEIVRIWDDVQISSDGINWSEYPVTFGYPVVTNYVSVRSNALTWLETVDVTSGRDLQTMPTNPVQAFLTSMYYSMQISGQPATVRFKYHYTISFHWQDGVGGGVVLKDTPPFYRTNAFGAGNQCAAF